MLNMIEIGEILADKNQTVMDIERKVSPIRAALQNKLVAEIEPVEQAPEPFDGREYEGVGGKFWELEDLPEAA